MVIVVEPTIANVINAVFSSFLVVGLLTSPQEFMKGGKYLSEWFSNLPEETNSYIYYMGQICSLVMLSTFVIPVIIAPSSQFLCYISTIMHGFMLVHFQFFIFGFGSYNLVKPTTMSGKIQWWFMFFSVMGLFVLSILASLHDGPTISLVSDYYNKDYLLALFPVNVAVMVMSSIFSLAFVLVPTQIISTFWEDNQILPNIICGFKQLQINGIVNWFARITGLAFLSTNLATIFNPVDGVENGLYHPLYSIIALLIMSLINLFNFNVIIMRQYEGLSSYLLVVSWIPNIILGGIFITLLTLTMVTRE